LSRRRRRNACSRSNRALVPAHDARTSPHRRPGHSRLRRRRSRSRRRRLAVTTRPAHHADHEGGSSTDSKRPRTCRPESPPGRPTGNRRPIAPANHDKRAPAPRPAINTMSSDNCPIIPSTIPRDNGVAADAGCRACDVTIRRTRSCQVQPTPADARDVGARG